MSDKKQNTNIDFSKFVNSDDLEESLDVFKGVSNLLNALELSYDSGSNEWDKYAFFALNVAVNHGINEIEALKPNIEYMGDYMREEQEEKRI